MELLVPCIKKTNETKTTIETGSGNLKTDRSKPDSSNLISESSATNANIRKDVNHKSQTPNTDKIIVFYRKKNDLKLYKIEIECESTMKGKLIVDVIRETVPDIEYVDRAVYMPKSIMRHCFSVNVNQFLIHQLTDMTLSAGGSETMEITTISEKEIHLTLHLNDTNNILLSIANCDLLLTRSPQPIALGCKTKNGCIVVSRENGKDLVQIQVPDLSDWNEIYAKWLTVPSSPSTTTS